MKLQSFPGRKIEFQEQTYLYFGGTAYLGLPQHKKFHVISAGIGRKNKRK